MQLITLIASHIDTRRRLNRFVKLLKIINSQIDYHDKINVRVSLSHSSDIPLEEIKFLIESNNPNQFQFVYQNEKMSQFQHYHYLIQTLCECDENDTWILFSDDDDEWANNRLAVYHYLININEQNDITTSICYTNDQTKMANQYLGRYVDYCVKLAYLKIFFAHTTKQQLLNKYCDKYLIKFIHMYGLGTLRRGFCATNDILYHHFESESTRNQTDEEILLEHLQLFMAQYNRHKVTDWMKYCEIYLSSKITVENLISLKKFMIEIYLKCHKNDIFHYQNLPVYDADKKIEKKIILE